MLQVVAPSALPLVASGFFSFRVLELWALSVLIVSVSLSLDKVLRVLIHSSGSGD